MKGHSPVGAFPPKPDSDGEKRMSVFTRLKNRFAVAWQNERGTASLEFVLVIPVIMTIFMSAIEGGVFMTRYIMLEQSVDMTMRNLRLGQYPNPTVEFIKDEICRQTVMMKGCEENIRIEMSPVSQITWAFPATSLACIDKSQAIQPTTTYNPGTAHEVMLVRVCVAQDAMFPTTNIGLKMKKDAGGAYGLIATAAFVNEP